MYITAFIVTIYLLLFILALKYIGSPQSSTLKKPFYKNEWFLIVFSSCIFRICIAFFTDGLNTDMNCWRAWSARAASEGPWGFYSDSYFCDYPPGYIYVLTFIGILRQICTFFPVFFDTFLLKLPAILCDIFLCGLLYRKTHEITKDTRLPLVLTLLYSFNPAIWVNSSVWGQVDSVFTLFFILSLMFLADKSFLKSAVLLSIATIIKPQALMFAPIYLLTIWENRKIDKFPKLLFLSIIGFIGVFILLVIPFVINKSPFFIFNLYKETLASYPYASVNAFNLATFLGGNWIPVDTVFAGLSFGAWGTLGILFSIIISGFVFLKGKDKSRYFYASALLICGIFVLGAKMHERYLFPTIALLFLAYAHRQDKRILALSCSLSLLHFINVFYVYIMHQNGEIHLFPPDAIATITSLFTVIAFLYMIYLGISLYAHFTVPSFSRKEKKEGISRKDVSIMAVICLLYAGLAFWNLGNTAAPHTRGDNEEVIDFGQLCTISSASVYKGIGDCTIFFAFSNDGINWSAPLSYEGSDCFKWENYSFTVNTEMARVYVTGNTDAVYEVAFFDTSGQKIPVNSTSTFFDEQDLAEPVQLFQNSTYFDEIYHARTAYEHIENVPGHYENTHPPLGKHIIGIGIRMFGMNPFGWRFMGTLFGILMLPLMYVFAKRLFKSTFLAACAMLLMTFDFMHFSQTRIATIDSYPVFFIILMYFFMYLFYEKSETVSFKKMCLFLSLSGISFGFAIASKWIGFYGGAGLAILFFVALGRRIRTKGWKEAWICILCVLFFIIIPFLIYFVSYIPIHIADGAESYWVNFWRYQKHMFDYHSQLKAEHPFSSMWYSWPFVYRPIWYYGNAALKETGRVSSIVGMGNPLIWWSSFIAILGCITLAIQNLIRKKKLSRPFFITIAYLSQLVPWMLVSRVVFIYHYFASLPFAMLALVYAFEKICEKFILGKRSVIIFLFVSGILFIMFYPVLSGTVIPTNYMLSALKWFPSWVLGYQ